MILSPVDCYTTCQRATTLQNKQTRKEPFLAYLKVLMSYEIYVEIGLCLFRLVGELAETCGLESPISFQNDIL